jgi:hypothetical protein
MYRFTGVRSDLVILSHIIFGGRYTPATYLILEFLSELLLIFIITSIVTSYEVVTINTTSSSILLLNTNFSYYEIMLLIMVPARSFYTFGKISSLNFDILRYLNPYNIMELLCLICLFIWLIDKQQYVQISYYHRIHSRIALSLSIIPLSLRMLQYLSTYKSFGILISIIIQTVNDVQLFIAVYLVYIFGFAIFFHSLFGTKNDSLHTPSSTALYLFRSTLGDQDFTIFEDDPIYEYIGIFVYVIFLIFTTVVLLNLLIAKINNTFTSMDENATEYFSFEMVRNVM